jgi:TM2 domain-containing membrane protein YozV
VELVRKTAMAADKFYDKFNSIRQHKRSKIIFVDISPVYLLEETQMVNIILSPRFYWVRKEALPVKYIFQAKEYAPSLFEGIVKEGNYSYKAIKNGDKFILFAYDAKAILEELERLGVKSSQIDNIYFAQTEFLDNSAAIKIDAKSALINQNEKLIKVPLSLTQKHKEMSKILSFHILSPHKIKIGKFNRFYEKKGVMGIVYVLLFLILILFIDIWYTSSIKNYFKAEEQKILTSYSLPSTSLQLNAMIGEYEAINSAQSAFRNAVSYLFRTPLGENERFESIKIDENKISLIIRAQITQEGRYKSYYDKFFKDVSSKNDGKNIIIEMRYE